MQAKAHTNTSREWKKKYLAERQPAQLQNGQLGLDQDLQPQLVQLHLKHEN